jgi:hypothetical protein
MSQTPPAALVRLREGDVVRLCGLEATARGMELTAHHAVSGGRRSGARLDAVVADGDLHRRAWIALPGDFDSAAAQWSCACLTPATDASTPQASAPLGCEHVAAILTSWIRSPMDFRGAEDAPIDQAAPAEAVPAPARLRQPALLPSPLPRRQAGASLAEELARLSSSDVLAVARRVLEAEPDEQEARAALAALLHDPPRLAALVMRLDHDAQTLLREIVLLGGTLTGADLEGICARSERPASAARADLGVLARHGLIFPVMGVQPTGQQAAERSWKQVVGWRMPPEIRAAIPWTLPVEPLPALGPHGPPALPAADGDQAATKRKTHPRVLRSSPRPLCLALALLARAPRPVGVAVDGGQARDATSEQHSSHPSSGPMLTAGDLAPQLLAEVARAAGVPPGLARLARRLLLWAGEAGSSSPLSDLALVPPHERARVLRAGFRLWAASETGSELADLTEPGAPVALRFERAHPVFRPAALAAEALAARRFALRLLAGARPGTWYALDDLLSLIWRIHPYFLRGQQLTYAAPAWWLEQPGERRPLRPFVHAEWLAGEGQYLRMLLTGPLAWWGALDLATVAEAAVAVRVTPFGAFLLARHEGAPEAAAAGGLTESWGPPLLPTRDGALAVQPLSADAALLATLEIWARPSQIAGGRVIYRFDEERACAAFDRGMDLTGLLAQVRRHQAPGDTRLESLVTSRLGDWRQRYGRTSIAHGWTLVEARDEATLREALAYVPEIAARCRQLGPSLALAPAADVEALREALGRRGYAL